MKDSWNKIVQQLSKRNISPDLLLDVGPGTTKSEAWLCREEYDCKIIGFEPHDKRFKTLKENYPGELFNVAVGETGGTFDGYEGIDFKIVPFLENKNFPYRKVKKNYVTIDSILKNSSFSRIILWADVEGSELSVLKGARKSLEKKLFSIILTEFLTENPSYNKKELDNFLSDFGYNQVETAYRDHIYVVTK